MKEHEKRELLRCKFDFFVENYTNGIEEIKNKIGVKSAGTLNSFRSPSSKAQISRLYMEAIERHFDIPVAMWESSVPCDKDRLKKKISDFQKKSKKEQEHTGSLFMEDKRLQNNLIGEWNTHLYSSIYKDTGKIHIFKTYFKENSEVVDYHNNRGKFFIGENQTVVIKKSPNEKNFSIILFPNIDVTYKIVHFSIISIQNGTSDEMLQYGFYSKKEYSLTDVKRILGEIDSVQLRLDMGFAKRVRAEFVVE